MDKETNPKTTTEQADSSAVDASVMLPNGVTEVTFRKYQVQENPFTSQPEEYMWLCEMMDSCVLDGTWNLKVNGRGKTQNEAYKKAVEMWEREA